jgi:septal ring factor EnvC (AmiA/AmiB activator)
MRWSILILALVAASPAHAAGERDEAEQQRKDVNRTIDLRTGQQAVVKTRAARLERDLNRLREELRKASNAMRARTREAAAAEDAAADAADAAETAEAEIDLRRQELAALVGAMARLSLRPPEALAALQDGPAEAARASLAFKALLPEVERRIEAARQALEAVARLRQQHLERLQSASLAASALADERKALHKTVQKKRLLIRQNETQEKNLGREVTKLAVQARSLDSFISALTAREAAVASARRAIAARQAAETRRYREELKRERAERARRQALARRPQPTPEPSNQWASIPAPQVPPSQRVGREPPVAALSGPPLNLSGLAGKQNDLAPPVAGQIIARFGQGEGVMSRGLVYAAVAGADVFSPFDGKIAYAGPFRGYGEVALIDHGRGYHTLLTGLDRIDVSVGDWVLGGEPLGALGQGMGRKAGRGGSGAGAPKLYVELRKNGEPVDPGPWFVRRT